MLTSQAKDQHDCRRDGLYEGTRRNKRLPLSVNRCKKYVDVFSRVLKNSVLPPRSCCQSFESCGIRHLNLPVHATIPVDMMV